MESMGVKVYTELLISKRIDRLWTNRFLSMDVFLFNVLKIVLVRYNSRVIIKVRTKYPTLPYFTLWPVAKVRLPPPTNPQLGIGPE